MSVHAPDLSDCGANADSGCIRGVGALLGAAHVLLGTGEAVDWHWCFCCLPVLLNPAAAAAAVAAAGLGTVAGFDLSAPVVTEAGSSLRRHLHPREAAAVSWNEGKF